LLKARDIACFGVTTAEKSEYQAIFIILPTTSYIYITLL